METTQRLGKPGSHTPQWSGVTSSGAGSPEESKTPEGQSDGQWCQSVIYKGHGAREVQSREGGKGYSSFSLHSAFPSFTGQTWQNACSHGGIGKASLPGSLPHPIPRGRQGMHLTQAGERLIHYRRKLLWDSANFVLSLSLWSVPLCQILSLVTPSPVRLHQWHVSSILWSSDPFMGYLATQNWVAFLHCLCCLSNPADLNPDKGTRLQSSLATYFTPRASRWFSRILGRESMILVTQANFQACASPQF